MPIGILVYQGAGDYELELSRRNHPARAGISLPVAVAHKEESVPPHRGLRVSEDGYM
jgi:hypothetical protein